LDADLAICRLAHKQGSVFVETDDAEADADGRQDIFGIVKQGQDKSIREAEANGADSGVCVTWVGCSCSRRLVMKRWMIDWYARCQSASAGSIGELWRARIS
jgi:hypothetical protein